MGEIISGVVTREVISKQTKKRRVSEKRLKLTTSINGHKKGWAYIEKFLLQHNKAKGYCLLNKRRGK